MDTPVTKIDPLRAQYDALPDSIRQYYSYEQYQWLPDRDKARIEQINTEPDQYDD